MAYISNEGGEGKSMITSERPSLTRNSRDCADTSRRNIDDQNCCHDRSPSIAVCDVEEDLNERISCR